MKTEVKPTPGLPEGFNDWAIFLKIRSELPNNDNNILINNKLCAKIWLSNTN
ncbi:hypothetical protein KSX_61740 [Ktedonospora formicarum]|uniref:Uncharacterized protein n=1 Tax=Ktedonospora formicarum TaxID=2778364 RepID=A0A8J3MVJ8_9CHLR|nr:hypothetical protein KSX_61740 [Ktedonospora formicarum]